MRIVNIAEDVGLVAGELDRDNYTTPLQRLLKCLDQPCTEESQYFCTLPCRQKLADSLGDLHRRAAPKGK